MHILNLYIKKTQFEPDKHCKTPTIFPTVAKWGAHLHVLFFLVLSASINEKEDKILVVSVGGCHLDLLL